MLGDFIPFSSTNGDATDAAVDEDRDSFSLGLSIASNRVVNVFFGIVVVVVVVVVVVAFSSGEKDERYLLRRFDET